MTRRNWGRRHAPAAAVAAGVDPATTAATGYWKNYAGDPWVDSASTGTSGGRNLHNASGDQPSVGASFGSHPSADFDGTQYLVGNPVILSDLISASHYTLQFICAFDTFGTPTSPWSEPALLSESNGDHFHVNVTSDGVRAGHNNTDLTTPILLSAGVKYCVQVKYDGVNVKCRVSGGSWQSVASAVSAFDYSTVTARIGTNYVGSVKIDGRIAQILTYATALSDATLDLLYADAQANYGVL